MRFSSRMSIARPASRAMASARSASRTGVRRFAGSLPSSRAKFWDSAMMIPRSMPACGPGIKSHERRGFDGTAFVAGFFRFIRAVLVAIKTAENQAFGHGLGEGGVAICFARKKCEVFHRARFEITDSRGGQEAQIRRCQISRACRHRRGAHAGLRGRAENAPGSFRSSCRSIRRWQRA